MAATDIFDDYQGVVWVQPDGPNTTVYPLLCADLDGIDEPQGDIVTRLCRQADRSWKVINRAQGAPGDVTFDIVTWKAAQANWLQRQALARCPIPVYVHWSVCGRADTFLNYDAGKPLQDGLITSKAMNNSARGRADQGDTPEKTGLTFSMTSAPGAEEYYPLISSVGDPAAEAEPIRDITTCTVPQCTGVCGDRQDICDDLHVAADNTGAAKADGYYSANNANTWTIWAAQPFAISEAINSLVCVNISRTVDRLIAMRGTTDAGVNAEISYSNDNGGTWTPVDLPASPSEFGNHSGSLFALDQRHIWACTNLANVFFSSDGGLTWVDQGAPAPAASEGLYYIHFADENYGWAVGGFRATPTGYLIQTTDGGAHWAMAASEPQVEMGVWVSVIDSNHVWIGMDDGTVWFSNNWGTTWTQRVMPTAMVNTGDGRFISEYEGAIGGYIAGAGEGSPVVFRTFNGGMDWEQYTYTTEFTGAVEYFGIEALQVCSINEIHAVGEPVGAVGLIWTLRPAGW